MKREFWIIAAILFLLIILSFVCSVFGARSSQWPKVRAEFLKTHPRCAVCGSTKKLEVHHIIPVHIDASKELDPNNLITLCESKKYGVNCHLWFGHLGSYRRYNPFVARDANEWNIKLRRNVVADFNKVFME